MNVLEMPGLEDSSILDADITDKTDGTQYSESGLKFDSINLTLFVYKSNVFLSN